MHLLTYLLTYCHPVYKRNKPKLKLHSRRPGNVLDDVVGPTPVGPRPIKTVQIAGGLEGADDEGRVGIGRSFRQERSAGAHERVHLAVAAWTPHDETEKAIK